jgi:hypothetical protein
VLDPGQLLGRPIPDLLVTGDDDQTLGADDGKPHVVERAAGHLG